MENKTHHSRQSDELNNLTRNFADDDAFVFHTNQQQNKTKKLWRRYLIFISFALTISPKLHLLTPTILIFFFYFSFLLFIHYLLVVCWRFSQQMSAKQVNFAKAII